ncbi:MAG: diacylglycerol kinase [Gammaproteobacteria bacterium RIFCSPLOWO2_12_47_11]|nr:MAG: diacylglycerol kinase [Gammaproteobacteria bacterium RIFCSPLOWO2_12_47_11]OGT86963.1 MAG: diacylglycerol kinase [Gammaproteobacteria bacterium RIFCSPLOWO2_12_FULL_47_76]
MSVKGSGGIQRLYKATIYSMQGLRAAFRNEVAFRLEVVLSIVLVPLGLWLGDNGVERALLVGSILLVMIVELINSGIEAVVDRFGGEQHELSGIAKDMGSAAVLVTLINVFVIWCLVLFF